MKDEKRPRKKKAHVGKKVGWTKIKIDTENLIASAALYIDKDKEDVSKGEAIKIPNPTKKGSPTPAPYESPKDLIGKLITEFRSLSEKQKDIRFFQDKSIDEALYSLEQKLDLMEAIDQVAFKISEYDENEEIELLKKFDIDVLSFNKDYEDTKNTYDELEKTEFQTETKKNNAITIKSHLEKKRPELYKFLYDIKPEDKKNSQDSKEWKIVTRIKKPTTDFKAKAVKKLAPFSTKTKN